ncbi:GTP diphosphokinase [Actinobacillus pleuropneumoniae]|uniref:GTP diphosphokinase n=1 Tax=Actinobacillus pleuropneumoniae TaxID=715 RepID=UPI001FFF9ACF|nr:GTP diphosphokinase [Actinobacillus pleuropneumoniae]MEE3682220.1 GTP diphosphokinase [Actinobacillus pleuropneumoniae]UPK77285.1 GTP diphosphokinase [Actinobacillus pleuropneumoniae]
MVAIRRSHELDPSTFELASWSAALQMSPITFEELQIAWRYAHEKLDTDTYHLMWDGIEMVEILHGLNMDDDSLVAALLFPLVKNHIIDLAQVKEDFGNQVKNLVKGVIEMDNIRQLSANSVSDLQIDNIRRMLLAMVDDFRCVVIKLAERIVYLRGKYRHTEEDLVLAAKECSHIYAPLANRLGIGQLKWELEDYCFRALHPQCYRVIALQLGERRLERESYIAKFVADLTACLSEQIGDLEVYGRPKHIYSIWKKMQKKNLRFEQLFDIRAVRVIVPNLEDCYTALGIIHTQYKHLPEHFDDYIANPKPNGYQSIHTVVLGEDERTIEVQIRTRAMHENAELGVAAHWKYKEGATAGRSGYEEKIVWLRKLLAWQNDIADSGEIMAAEMRSQVFDDRVYVFTPKGEVIDLPKNATPLDFAYAIHSEVGHRCIGAKVAGRIVPFTYLLQMGDQVEIITQKNPNPSRDWLNPNAGFVNTSKARAKIIAWFKKLDREKNIPLGKEALEAEMARFGFTYKQIEQYALPRYNLKQFDDLYAGIGGGDIRLNQLSHYLQSKLIKPTAEQEDEAVLKQVNKNANNQQHKGKNGQIIIDGVGNLMHTIARCCQPIPGDEIVGYITQGRGISIHRADCEQLFDLRSANPERVVNAQWGTHYANGFSLAIRVTANDRNGLLRDVSAVMANEKVNVLSVSSRIDAKRSLAIMDMSIELNNIEMLGKLFARIAQLDDVIEAKRLSN